MMRNLLCRGNRTCFTNDAAVGATNSRGLKALGVLVLVGTTVLVLQEELGF
jgi:hypothetical protein